MPRKRRPELAEKESRIQQAVAALRRTRNLSIKRAAELFDVPRTTLSKRFRGRLSRRESHSYLRSLTLAEEDELVRWISKLTCTGFAPKHALIKEMAESIRNKRLQGINDSSLHLMNYRPLGRDWVANFLQRHEQL